MKLAMNRPNVMDGRTMLGRLRNESVRCAFFDPQYRGLLDKMAYGNEGARQAQRAKLKQMDNDTITAFIGLIEDKLAPSGYLFLWVDKFSICSGQVAAWRPLASGLRTVDLIAWDGGKLGMGYRSRQRLQYCVVVQKEPVRAKATWHRHDIPDLWQEPREAGHPHAKPVGLQARLIEAVTRPGDFVVDPAAGGYSVLRACEIVGRDFYGADLRALTASGGGRSRRATRR